MIRWLLNLINPGRNKSTVFTDTPGGVSGMTWDQAKEWAIKGYMIKRAGWSDRNWYVDWNVETGFLYHPILSEMYMYHAAPSDELSCDWYVVGEGR